MRPSAPCLLPSLLAACASAPPADPVAVAPEVEIAPLHDGDVAAGPPEPDTDSGAGGLTCRCDVLDFESDGPPYGRCRLAFDADGVGTLKGETSKPRFSARLVPIPGEKKRVDYAFEGAFDFACNEPWCGHQELSVLAVAEHDYRIVVERSADGPPSRVLWLTCTPK